MLEERYAATRTVLRAAGFYPLDRLDILEIGCGNGSNLSILIAEGAEPSRIVGIDLFEPTLL